MVILHTRCVRLDIEEVTITQVSFKFCLRLKRCMEVNVR